ncbi:MAG: Ig-like domain-containing protein, partial [Spirulina sp.]
MVNNSIFSSQLREELEFTSFVENNKSPLLILELAQDLARGKLQDFAKTRDFVNQMTQVFGEGHNLVDLQSDWTAGEAFFPAIEVRTIDELDGAYGAFSQDTGRIYLAQELLERSSPDAINAILLEEYGHFIDAQLNLLDTLGDEGAMFSAFVRGETLTSQEIQGIAIEDDIVTITLDDRIIQIEKASISGSGGEGGTNQTIQLDPLPSNQTNKGNVTVKYSYEHFSIPDQFTIRYEGKNIFDTGGLVSGSRSGTVTIPRGEENSIEVKVTAPEEGTAWNFFVTTESCSDTTPLKIEAVGGEFKDSDGDGDCEFDGTVIIGRTDGNPELIRVANGTVEYDDKEIRVTNGTVFSKIGNVSSPLFQGDFTIPFSSARSSSFKEKGNIANDFKLGGLDVDFKSIFLDQNDIKLGTEFSLPEEITGSAIKVTLLPDGIPSSNANVKPDALIISNNGVQLGASSKVKLPDLGSFKLFNLAEIGASDLSISYSAPDDTLKLQGKLSLSKFTKSEKPTLEADLSGKNFIQVRDGKADVKGSLSVKNVGLPGGWGLEEAKITLDTIANKVGGEVGVTFPWGKTVPPKNVGAKLGLDFMIDPLQLDGISAGVTLPDPGVPVGTTGIFLNGVDGSIGNLAPSDSNLIEFQGGVDLSGGPKFLGGSLIKADLDVKVNPNELSGSGKLTLIDDKIANANGNTTLNWNKGFLKTKSNFSILDGTITTNSSFTATSAFDIKFGGQASVNVPKSIPVIGGKSLASGDYAFDFSNNGNSSDDFAAGWGQFNIPLVFSTITITAGVKGSFDGQFEFIGARNIPETNSFDVETGTEWVVLSADWENANPNTKVRIKTPTGAFIDEVDFAANNFTIVPDFTDEDTRAIAIPNPSPGIWDIVVVDSTGLGTIDYHAIRDSIAPTIEITSPISDISSNGSVNIGFNALDSDSTAKIQLFYDDDNTGLDGILLTDSLVENDGVDSFTWNTEGVPTGEYYIYALIMDDENVPVFSDYSTGKVKITESVDIAVTSTISSDAAVIEDNFTYKIAVKNEGNSTSKGVVLTNSLPSEVTFISASIAPSQQSEDELIFNLGDLGSGETKSLEIVVKAPATPTTISNTVSASSQTFDPSINNNTSILVTSIEPSTASADLSLTAVSTNTPLKIGDRLSYDFLITNNGTSTATEVVLNASPPSGLQNIITSEGQIDINTITANLGSINAGESKTVSISGDIITAGTLTFTASVQNSQTDSNVLNNSLILQHPVSATIPSPADLELAMSVDRPRAKVGDLVTIQLTLTNKGSGAATAIQVKNLLPQGLNFVSSSA